MKKLILKIISVIIAFFLGILIMGHYMSAGNNELMDSMAKASLPLVSVVLNGREMNRMHGHVGEMDGKSIRGDVIPLPEDRKLSIVVDPYETTVSHIFYEVRSLDHERLIEDTEAGFTIRSNRIEAELPIKDLLDPGEEYALIIQLETEKGATISYYSRIANIGENSLDACLEFAKIWHDATYDKENKVSITQYLESDSTADNATLGEVSIHSRYRQIIWDQMNIEPYSDVDVYVTEIDPSVTALHLDFVNQYQDEDGKTEYYQVQEYFRIRYTEQRMYLLDYYRTTNRIFEESSGVFGEDQLELGILDEDVHYLKNEEENIVAFVQNGELWSYDVARNNLIYVMGFRDGWDIRAGFTDHDIRIMNIDEAGSMDFLLYGYMNRGNHEGKTGVAVYHYDSVANTVEEKVFLKSRKPYAMLKEELGDLAYVTQDKMLYLYLEGNIYVIDLDTRECRMIAQGLPKECCWLSVDRGIMAWQDGNTLYEAEKVFLLNLDTGRTQTITAGTGEYVRGLGFMGTDFIWGAADQADIVRDPVGNTVFPMYKISIQGQAGETIREFEYREKGKYVLDVSMEDNRISLACVTKTESGSYVEATPEPITNKAEEKEEKIFLKTKSTNDKKREFVLAFTDKRETADPRKLMPKQVMFEGNRTIELEHEESLKRYYVYGRGRLISSYNTVREAVAASDEVMGVVTDQRQTLIWNRGGRKTRTQISGIEEPHPQPGESGLETCLLAILNFEKVYPDVKGALEQGKNAYAVLDENLEEVLDLSGCTLDNVLYYVSQGKPVLALTEASDAVLIVGYDPQNTILFDPDEGIRKMGINDSREFFEEAGNLFIGYR